MSNNQIGKGNDEKNYVRRGDQDGRRRDTILRH
jgi:hypothetical protein